MKRSINTPKARLDRLAGSTQEPPTVAEGAEVVIGDFDDAETLVHALQGVERAFLLTNSARAKRTF